MAWFKKEPVVSVRETKSRMPEGLWVKCESCKEIVYKLEVERNGNVCPKCQYHFRISARQRLALLVDEGSFQEYDATLTSADPLRFVDTKAYPDRVREAQKATGMAEALLSGEAAIGGFPVELCIFEFNFMGGSMASVVGEKIVRAIERAMEKRWPLMILTCSGGARMQEGPLALMQLARTSTALGRLRAASVPFFSILCDPTTGGVTASVAMLGDVIIAEPRALISFAGPRVIQDTIKQELPPGFQRAEFLLEHGFVDMVVPRRELRQTLTTLLGFFAPHSP